MAAQTIPCNRWIAFGYVHALKFDICATKGAVCPLRPRNTAIKFDTRAFKGVLCPSACGSETV